MQQEWNIYAPEGRDNTQDTKMALRRRSNCAFTFGMGEIIVSPVSRDNFEDDVYTMKVNDEEVTIVARERVQRTYTKEVYDNLAEGIFFKVSEANTRAAESRLLKAFGKS